MPPAAEVRAYVALGSNLGDRERNIREALRLLDQTNGTDVTKVSSMLDNPAVGGPEGSPRFLNAAAEVKTSLGPHELLDRLLAIEQQLGRTREIRWEPRIIDLDLLLYGDQVIRTPTLTVPHPLLHERPFVLGPLAEIAPDVVHPVQGRRIRELQWQSGNR